MQDTVESLTAQVSDLQRQLQVVTDVLREETLSDPDWWNYAPDEETGQFADEETIDPQFIETDEDGERTVRVEYRTYRNLTGWAAETPFPDGKWDVCTDGHASREEAESACEEWADDQMNA